MHNYTKPVVCKSGNEYYVFFSFYHNGQKYDRKLREGINRIKNEKQRIAEAEALAEARHIWLQNGWNPVIDPKFEMRNANAAFSSTYYNIPDALRFAVSKKKLAKKTIRGYQNQVDHLCSAAHSIGLHLVLISDIKRAHVKALLETVAKERQLSNHGYNKYADTLRAMLSELMEWEFLEYNPASKISKRKVAESTKYATWTQDEKDKLTEALFLKHYRLFVLLQMIYHTGIRPKEILSLQIRSIHMDRREIHIEPDIERENSKTTKFRKVPINDHLYSFLRELRLYEYPENYYVFGSPYNSGMGNRGAGSEKGNKTGAMRSDYFLPSPNRIKRDTLTKLFKRIVKDELKIDKYMYALKHTGGDDKIIAGVDLDALRSMYGHSSKRMTEVYVKEISQVYKNEIISKSPEFSKKKKPD